MGDSPGRAGSSRRGQGPSAWQPEGGAAGPRLAAFRALLHGRRRNRRSPPLPLPAGARGPEPAARLIGASLCRQLKREISAQQPVGHSHPDPETALLNVNLDTHTPKKTPKPRPKQVSLHATQPRRRSSQPTGAGGREVGASGKDRSKGFLSESSSTSKSTK